MDKELKHFDELKNLYEEIATDNGLLYSINASGNNGSYYSPVGICVSSTDKKDIGVNNSSGIRNSSGSSRLLAKMLGKVIRNNAESLMEEAHQLIGEEIEDMKKSISEEVLSVMKQISI